jgi:hypothetical protein
LPLNPVLIHKAFFPAIFVSTTEARKLLEMMKNWKGIITAIACMILVVSAYAHTGQSASFLGNETSNTCVKPKHRVHSHQKNKKRYDPHQHSKNRHSRVAEYSAI